ncbi:MAG: InlB B-repeat-containing protein, partial [Faecousia sp.]
LSVASDLYLIPVFDSDTEYWTVKFCHPDGSLENVYLVEQAAIEGTEFFIADKEYSLYPDAEWMLTSGDVDEVAVGELVSTNYITVRSDVVFTAVVPDTYTILFCSEEGYLMDARFIMENELIGAGPVAPAKEGYTFVGWQDENGELLTDDTVATRDAVYTPVYEKILYPIILVPSEHVQLGVLPESAQAGVGDIITIGTAAEVGYETYCVCVYYQNAAEELVPVAITPMPSNAPYDSPDMNGYTFVMPAGPVAVWVIEEANRNTAKFLVDGAIYGLEYILSGEAPAAPVEPVKEGYTFLGWKALSTGKEYPVGTEFDPIYADETYVALFEINTYDLTYYRGAEADASEYKCILALPDGTFVEFFNNDTTNMPTYLVADVTYGDIVVLAEPMLPGYVFKGWVDENGYMHPAGAKYTMPARDVLLTAVWEEDTELSCLVRFVNDGELYDAYLAYNGQDASIPAIDPTCDGKLFLGWKYGENTYSNTGVKDFTVVASDAREMTFEAVWEDILYTVTYTDYETFTDIAYGTELVTLPAPEQEGYTFVAWQCAENGAYYFANTAFTVKGDMTFTAVWAKNDVEYTVKFFDENGNLVDIFVAEENAELTAPVYEQGRDDAEYVWVDAEHNTYLHEGESFTAAADCSYRATLIDEAQYPVFIYVDSEDDLDNVATADKNEYFLGENVYIEITVPEGYVLKAVSAAGTGNELLPIKDSLLPMGGEEYLYIFEMPAAPVAVLVELEKIPAGYTAVKFVNDGDLYDYMIVQKGSNAYAPETAPVKDGYTFIEWRSESSFVAPGGEFAVPAEAGSELVYTAVWEAIDYMVEYRPDGGMPDPDDVHGLHYGDKLTLADAPVKGGYVFIGWVEESTGFLYGAGCTYTVTGDAVFTAKWEQAECVVRFLDPSSGIIYGYEALKQGEQVTAPAAPIVSGKTFLYWVNAEDDTDRVFAGAMTPALYTDTVYHAVFETSKHNISVSTEHCAVSPASFGAKEVGELIEFTVTADADYALKLVTVSYFDGTSFVVRELTADENGVYSFYMPDAEVTITAKAVQNVYSIFTSSDAHTLIQVVNGNKAAVGETVLFTVEVTDENYEPDNVFVSTASGKPIALSVIHIEGTFFAYAFTMPAEDVTIYADAAQGERTVTFLDSDNTLLGIVPVGAGDYVTDAPIAAREGYTFAGWERLPEKTPYDPERDAVTENLIVRATYVGDAHTVAAGLKENVYALHAECTVSSGNVNSSDLLGNALTAETGKTVYFTVAANYDYVITDIAVVSAEGTNLVVEPTLREKKTEDNIVYYTYSFTMPAEDVMIDVYTAPKLFTTTVVENIPEGGTYTINGFYTSNLWILQGETVTIDITPAEGYIVKNVYGEFTDNFSQISKVDGTLDGNTFTFPMVAKDVIVYIEYEAIVYGIDIETSNFATYKPDASVNPAKVVESLDPALTSQGIIRIVGGETRDYTNELEQVYKIPANGEATNGTRVAFTVEEFTGYDLVSVTVTYDNGEKSCMLTYKDGVYYFDMPADDVVITAVFTEETYKVSKDAASEAHGEVLINGLRENIVSADYKDEITVTVTPDDGWQISKIYYVLADGTVLDFDAASYAADAALTDALDTAHSITFHMPASDVTVYVEYAAIEYTVNVETQEAEVEVFYSPSNVGEQVSFEVTANYGYIISKVYVTNDTTGERVYHHTDSTNQLYGAWYTFTMPASSVTIHVETIKDEYNVKYLDNGALIAYENIEYMDTANVAAHVEKVVNGKAGYHFVGWVSSDVETPVTVPSVTDADFVVVKDTFIYAAYERDEIDVLFKATENGTVTELSTGNTAEYRLDTTVFGDTVEFTAVPDVGYVVDTVSVTTTNGEGYNLDIRYTEQDGKYTFVIPASYKDNIHVVQAEDVIVTVTFKKDAYTLTKADDCGTNGTIAVNGAVTTQTSFTYEYQDEVTITATPDNGYYVVSVTAQNADGSTVYTVTGEKPATDTPVGDSLTLSFAMPAEDLTYTVVYAKIDYSITTVFDATQGSVATEPAGTAQLDDIVTVTVTPKEGYELAELTVTYAEGEKSCVLTEIEENVYTFTMPADAVVVTAIFTEITYTANLTIVGEGSGTLNGYYTDNMPADYLDTVTVTAAPAEGWELVSIEVDGGKIKVNEEIKPEGGAYTFTMPSHDVEITVTFEKTGYGLDSYALNFFEEGHGTVTLDPETTAYVGDRIIISADPDDGYRVKSVTVIDEFGYAVPVSFISGTPGYVETWSFTMPAAAVDIYVVFEVQGASYYDDVRTDHWFYEAVTFVTDRGYFYGISEDLFAPYMNMNRAMFVTVLGRISGVDVSKYTGIAFTDVEEGSYYAPYVAWAAENGIVIGRDAETFDPYANITREEMAAIMYRYCDFLGVDMTLDNEVFMDRYVDRDDISDWAVTYVEWAVGAGLIRGMSDNTIDPLSYATRAQVAQVIKNLCDKVLYK